MSKDPSTMTVQELIARLKELRMQEGEICAEINLMQERALRPIRSELQDIRMALSITSEHPKLKAV